MKLTLCPLEKNDFDEIASSFEMIGLGVGMTADYGNAQRLYVHLGYIPDGRGLHYKCAPLKYGNQVTIDDDLVLFLKKSILL